MARLKLSRSVQLKLAAAASRIVVAIVGTGLVWGAATHLAAQSGTPGAELLNSERIERAFGSYGIEVLESDAGVRVSSLYSFEREQRVCRTFAVVRYATAVDPRLASEHAAILAGGSIGATFANRGWTVLKTQRYLGEIAGTPRLSALMRDRLAVPLAVHVYAFDVEKDGVRLPYAMIVEVHHPDYLDLAKLRAIYAGDASIPASPDSLTRELLELVAAKIGA